MRKLHSRVRRRLGAVVCGIGLVVALLATGSSSATLPLAPIDVGQWSAVQNWPLVAVHSALQPTGQVLYWDAFNFAPDSERLWDPVLNTFIQVPYSRNLFCSGHIEVGDGRTVVFGGHIESNVGLHDTTIYNPQTQTWTRGPDMTSGRWYPTATTLGDGRVLVVSGDNMILGRTGVPEPFIDTSNTLPEVYNPTSNTWTDLPQAQRFIPLYPFMFVMPDGRVFDAGPDTVNRALNVDTGTWSVIANSPFDGGSAVMYRAGKILKTGTWGDSGVDYPGDGRAAVIDLNQPSPAWREVAPMAFARQFHNLIALPDGNVLAMGGATRGGGVDPTKAVLTPEIWNATSETWTSMAPMATPRMYHSTSLLLPDGRVVVAGGGRKGGATDFPSAEIYSPPYLFRGPRPTISSAPGQVQYGSSFDVTTPDAANIASISLIHSGSMTHAFDENQRLLMLNFTRGSGKVTVTAPANGNLAPPGYYMLFIVDSNGVPSVGSFVRVTTTLNDTTPPTPPGNLSASPGSGQVSLSWSASSDNVGVARYDVYRSTTPGFTPGAGNRIAQPSGTSYSDTGLAAGTYYYKVQAEDAAGNLSAPSNEASATVSSAPPVGLVAAYSFDQGSGSSLPDLSGNSNNGTIANASWSTSGKYGSALSFNGTNAIVNVPDSSSLDLTSGMTLEAWVNPSALGNAWRTVLMKETSGDMVYDLYGNRNTTVPTTEVRVGGSAQSDNGTSALPLNTWVHLASTYDGNVLRLYVNGSQVSQLLVVGSIATSTGALRIGGNNIWPEWFAGLIDEVRVYNRALTQSQIQADMNAPLGNVDTQPPSAPANLSASGSLSSASLSWSASTDNVGVARYDVYRSTTPGFTPGPGNRIAQPTGMSYTDTGLAAGTYYYKVLAEDAAGNLSAPSNEATALVTGDTQPPSAPANLSASGSLSSVSLSWSASSDNVGVARYDLYRSTTPGFTPGPANRIAQPSGTSYTDTGLSAGSYYYKVIAEDAAGNLSAPSNEASASVTGDTTPPSVPGNLAASPGPGQVSLSWNASSDNVGVLRYDLYRSTTPGFTPGAGNRIAQPTGTSYTDTGLGAGTYYYKVQAEDAAGNLSAPSNEASATVSTAPPVGLVAAYSFDQGSGSSLPDLSGNGNNGTIANASWSTSGKYGSALSFNGTNAIVNVPDSSSLDLTSGMTLEAWVNPSALGNAWRTVLMKEQSGNLVYDLYANGSGASKVPVGEVYVGGERTVAAPSALTVNTWTHLAVTYDGSVLALYRNGSQVATLLQSGPILTSTGALRIGGNTIWSEWFAGLIDEVRVYNRALTQPQIQADLNTPLGVVDTQPPSAPANLTASGSLSSVSLSWSASSDNVGVARYDLYRSTTPGFTPGPANRIAQPSGTSYTDTGLSAGSYYYKVIAEDAAGNLSAPSNEASASVTGDTTPPSVPGNLAASPGPGQVSLSWNASSDNVGVLRYDLYRSTTPGFTPGAGNRIAQPTGTSYTDTGLGAGTYYYKVQAEDAAGNLSAPSNEASATVSTAPPVGLVAAYSFDQGSGSSLPDLSGNGNNGTIANASWSTSGKYGSALSFNGTNAIVNVPDSSSLDLTSGMTLEAWVNPSALGNAWRTVLMKETSGDMVYDLYGNRNTTVPTTEVRVGGSAQSDNGTSALPLNTWVHLASTYDGNVLRLYVNGSQVSQLLVVGSIATSTGALRIGGNNIWPEWFAGLIDEVRVYNRALTQSQIQADMNTRVGP